LRSKTRSCKLDYRESGRQDQWNYSSSTRATEGTNGTKAITRATNGTTGRDGVAGTIVRATDRTSGTTRADIRQGRTRVARSSVHAEDAITPEPSTDLEVNGPLWDSHFVDTVPESDDNTNSRTRVMHQASRRVIHTGAIASRATDGTIHSPAASGAALGSGTQSCWQEVTNQSTRTGDSSGGSDSRDTRSDRTRSRQTSAS
jgi:hypothetical protein